jgi:hypothetical protein
MILNINTENFKVELLGIIDKELHSSDVMVYYFEISLGVAELKSIEKFESRSAKGNTYNRVEIYHYSRQNLSCFNHETGEFEEIKIPDTVIQQVNNYLKGSVINNLTNQQCKQK